MSSILHLIKSCGYSFVRKPNVFPTSACQIRRHFSDKTKPDTPSKQLVVQGTENEGRLRVRRARPADVPRVMRFVRERARDAWPALVTGSPTTIHNVLLADFIARSLSQGHSMLAEQQEAKRGWTQIRGLALCSSVCPWDAVILEKCARCVRCAKVRQLMLFTSHCLHTPALHDKYRVNKILQVVVMVPPDSTRSAEIASMLVKHCLHRGQELGFPLLRFDVTSKQVSEVLDKLQLRKEWEFNYEVLLNSINIFSSEIKTAIEAKTEAKAPSEATTPSEVKEGDQSRDQKEVQSNSKKSEDKRNLLVVYTAFPNSGNLQK